MGWKTACILVNEREPGYLGTLPRHIPQTARDLIQRLGLRTYRSLGLTNFNYGVFPEKGRFVIGAYDGAAVIAGQELIYGAVMGDNTRILDELLRLYSNAELLVLELHSVVNYFAYASYRYGELRRAYAGDAEHGVFVEIGEPLLEEQSYFAHSIVQDGIRAFELDGETWTVDQVGDSLVFTMASRFLGEALDDFASEDLIVEEFEMRTLSAPGSEDT